MDLLRRWTGQGQAIGITPIAWVLNGHPGDYNSRLAVANALAPNSVTLDAEGILRAVTENQSGPSAQDKDAVIAIAVAAYHQAFTEMAGETNSKPNFLVAGIGLKRQIPFANIKLGAEVAKERLEAYSGYDVFAQE